ncbi:MAG: TRASH domain-containing protein [Thermodesulfobacteriota bacterium]
MIKVMARQKSYGIYTGLLMLMLGVAVMVFSGTAKASSSADKYKVDASIVCMVNDNVMGKPQIPVKVEGKTYYGCCRNCVKTLNEDAAMRAAKDPFSGKMVDKSSAFIIEGPGGEALYFESALTAGKFVDAFSK